MCFNIFLRFGNLVILGGFGHHVMELAKFRILRCLKLGFSSQILYTVTLGFVKISICAMLARIFSLSISKLIAQILIGLSCCWMTSTVLIGFLICHPVQMNWNPLITDGKCGDRNLAFTVAGIVNVMTDFFILLVPIPMVLKLTLPKASKFGLLLIFCMGILTMVIGSVRITVLLDVDFMDFTFSGKTLHIFTIAEAGVAIMVSSSPMLRPILNRVSHSSIFSTKRSSGNNRGSKDRDSQSNTPSANIFSTSLRNSSQDPAPAGDTDINFVSLEMETHHITTFGTNPRSTNGVDDMETVFTPGDSDSTKAIV
ncbi:hypothetical protein BGZ60DRAFT_415072 [Tricladium varicosporioides]|nr:hypothetical protein BGZ60DRAFT_415072 [Hymenoscyphus varicosporioides]